MSADEFWGWFNSQQAGLRDAPGQTVADRVEARLRQLDSRIGLEVGDPGQQRELVFTAWSRPDVFPAVRALMAAAPRSLPGWTLVALKPPRGFDFAIDVEGLQIDASRLRFDGLASPQAPAALGVRVYVGVGAPSSDPRWAQALALIIETGIGEEAAAEIDYVEPYGGPPPDERALPIAELLPFVQWHRRRHPKP